MKKILALLFDGFVWLHPRRKTKFIVWLIIWDAIFMATGLSPLMWQYWLVVVLLLTFAMWQWVEGRLDEIDEQIKAREDINSYMQQKVAQAGSDIIREVFRQSGGVVQARFKEGKEEQQN